jgi:hypothetical protein
MGGIISIPTVPTIKDLIKIAFNTMSPSKFLDKYGPYHFFSFVEGDEEHSKKLYTEITKYAFKGAVIHPQQNRSDYSDTPDPLDPRDYLIKDEISSQTPRNIIEFENALGRNNKPTLGIQIGFRKHRIATNEKTIIETLRAGYPITFGMDIFNYKLNGSSIPFDPLGMLTKGSNYVMLYTDSSQHDKTKKIEGHQVVAIGCKRLKDGQTYLKIRNSWGSNWGEDGHFYMPITYATQNDSVKGVVNISNPTVITLLDDPFPIIPRIWFKDYDNIKQSEIAITTDDSEKRNENIINFTPYTHLERINLMNYLYLENVEQSKLTFRIYVIRGAWGIQSLPCNAKLSGSYLIIDRCDKNPFENAGGCIITVSSKFTKTQSVTFKWDKYVSPKFYAQELEDPELFPYLRSPFVFDKLEKLTRNQKWTVSSPLSSDFYSSSFRSNLHSLIINNINNIYFPFFMAIFSKSNGPINFRLGTVDDGSYYDGVNPRFYFGPPKRVDNSEYTRNVTVKCEGGDYKFLSIETAGNYMGAIQGEIASGIFTLFVTQDATYQYRRSVIKIALEWSIVSSYSGPFWANKEISFKCLRVYGELNNALN